MNSSSKKWSLICLTLTTLGVLGIWENYGFFFENRKLSHTEPKFYRNPVHFMEKGSGNQPTFISQSPPPQDLQLHAHPLQDQTQNQPKPQFLASEKTWSKIYQKSSLMSAEETSPDPKGDFKRTQVMRTSFQYPFIRIEEGLHQNFSTGEVNVTQSVAMVADHLMVQLQPGYSVTDLAEFAQKLGYRIRSTVPFSKIYLVTFSGKNPDSLTQAQSQLNKSQIVEISEPDYLVQAQ